MTSDTLLRLIIIIVYFLFHIIGLFILSLTIYYIVGRTRLKERTIWRSFISITPIIILGAVSFVVGSLRLSYFVFAVCTAIFLFLLSKIKHKTGRIALIILMLIVLFPKPAGYSDFMSQKGYRCECLGVRDTITGIDTFNDVCYGLPLICREYTQDYLKIPASLMYTPSPTPQWMNNPMVVSHAVSVIPGHEMLGFGYYIPNSWKQISDGRDITTTAYDTGIPIIGSATKQENYQVYIEYYRAGKLQRDFPEHMVPSEKRTVNAPNGDFIGTTLAPYYSDRNNENDVLAQQQFKFMTDSLKFSTEDGSY